MEWSDEIVTSAINSYQNLLAKIKNLGKEKGIINQNFKNKFLSEINDDLNMPKALAVLQEVLKSQLSNKDKLATILDFDKVLGLELDKIKNETETEIIPEEIKKLVKERETARLEKNWTKSDELRKKINSLGYEIRDTNSGSKISKI